MPDQPEKKDRLSGDENGKYDNLRQRLKQLVAGQSVDSRLKSRFDASDVIQNILVDLHEKGKLDDVLALPPDEQKKVLKRVATHDLCDEIKKQKTDKRDIRRERPLALGDESSASPVAQESRSAPVGLRFEDHSTPSEVAAKNEMNEALQRALARLPEKHRLVS
jgi:DNA-directed RNA polymerase specialized sigma24 family protein